MNLSGVCKTQNTNSPQIFEELQYENRALKQENAGLNQEAICLNSCTDYLQKWESSQSTIEDLQRENENLRRENQELRDEIIPYLKSQISDLSAHQSILMKSFQRENKLALRQMVDDAKKKGLESTYRNT